MAGVIEFDSPFGLAAVTASFVRRHYGYSTAKSRGIWKSVEVVQSFRGKSPQEFFSDEKFPFNA